MRQPGHRVNPAHRRTGLLISSPVLAQSQSLDVIEVFDLGEVDLEAGCNDVALGPGCFWGFGPSFPRLLCVSG